MGRQFFILILSFFVLLSCSTSTTKNADSIKNLDSINKDSLVAEMYAKHLTTTIPDPIDITKLKTTNRLEYTTGGGTSSNKTSLCDSLKNGFYGRYNIYDRQLKPEPGVAGYVEIFKVGNMGDWKQSDTDQIIWEIHLRTSVLAVWDSIKVGNQRSYIDSFIKEHNGLCIKKGDNFYSCSFNNYGTILKFQNDTLTELKITRQCKQSD